MAEKISGDEFWDGVEAEELETLIETLRQESFSASRLQISPAPAPRSAGICKEITVREIKNAGITAFNPWLCWKPAWCIRKTVILGGLNEGTWPRLPDPGPWLNRPMRDIFGMQQPELSIGQEAHDFVQAFGAPHVFLTWARRDGMDPAIPSRWILRLQTILKAAGYKLEDMPFRTLAGVGGAA